MRCVICKGTDIKKKNVEEEVKVGQHIVLVPLCILVCNNCGERYYDRAAMRKIEEVRERFKKHTIQVEEVGKVFRTI